MIVVDEQIHDAAIRDAIDRWYRGSVVSIVQLRRNTLIKDDSIPALLHQANSPTFVTINVDDFWLEIQAHRRYCVVNIPLPLPRRREAPALLRKLLQHAKFKTKADRMGKVIRVTQHSIAYYSLDRQLHAVEWE